MFWLYELLLVSLWNWATSLQAPKLRYATFVTIVCSITDPATHHPRRVNSIESNHRLKPILSRGHSSVWPTRFKHPHPLIYVRVRSKVSILIPRIFRKMGQRSTDYQGPFQKEWEGAFFTRFYSRRVTEFIRWGGGQGRFNILGPSTQCHTSYSRSWTNYTQLKPPQIWLFSLSLSA